jgi:hypothetical protein
VGGVGEGNGVVDEAGQFLDGLAVDVELGGVIVDAGEFVVVVLRLKLDLVLAFPEATHLPHPRTVLLQGLLAHLLQAFAIAGLRLLAQLRDGPTRARLREHPVLEHARDLDASLGVELLPVAVLLALVEEPLVDVVGSSEAALALVEAVLEEADVLLSWPFDVELAGLAAVGELALELSLVVVGEFDAETVLEAVEELPVVEAAVVEVEEALVGLVAGDGEPVVDAVLELLYGRGGHHHLAPQAQVREEGEDLRRLRLLHQLLLQAVLHHLALPDVADSPR